MSDFPSSDQIICPVVSTESLWSWGGNMVWHTLSAVGSATWNTNNQAIYIPFSLPCPFRVKSIWLYNGATAAGNIDLGVLALDGTLIFSTGATAQAGTNTLQIISVAEIILPPGAYFFACSCSTTSATITRHGYGTAGQIIGGVLRATSQHPLTTMPTFLANNGPNPPIMGISSITTF